MRNYLQFGSCGVDQWRNLVRVYAPLFLAALILASHVTTSHAETLQFSFTDAAGDQPSMIPDVVGLVFTFDHSTGDFEAVLSADPAAPFAPTAPAKLGVHLNLFNPDLGVTTKDPSFFQLLVDLQLSAATTSLTLTGTNSRLTAWAAGDRVAIDSSLGNPDGTGLFGSEVVVSQDRTSFGGDFIAPGAVATISSVPEPTTATLVGGLLTLALLVPRRAT
jgi:hypothetical protein